MNENTAKKILQRLFQNEVEMTPLTRSELKDLPIAARNRFLYARVAVGGEEFFLVCEGQSDELGKVAMYAKWKKRLERILGGRVVFGFPPLAARFRYRYNKEGLPYISEDGSAYVPGVVSMSLKAVAVRTKTPDKLSALAQLMVLRDILWMDVHGLTKTELAQKLGYSRVAVGTAVKELVDFGLSEYEGCMRMTSRGKALWEVSRKLMGSPIVSTCYLGGAEQKIKMLQSGETALSCMSLLEAPAMPVVALGRREFYELRKAGGTDLLEDDYGAAMQLQVWRYSPDALVDSSSDVVDVLSLMLSFDDSVDARIQQELLTLKMPW